MDYLDSHKLIYDSLAEEYEARNDALLQSTEEGVDFLASFVPQGSSVLELGCGSGLASRVLTERGFVVTAIDISPNMIRTAERCNPDARYLEGDFLETAFDRTFNCIFAFAFIHLFPKRDAVRVLQKAHNLLAPSGFLYIGTTKEEVAAEGWEIKSDYRQKLARYRKRWTQLEFEEALRESGFELVEHKLIPDAFGKVWMDYLAKKV